MHVFIAALHRPIKPTGVCRHAVNLALCLAETEVTKISLVIGAWQADYFKTAFALESDKIELVIVDIKNSSLVRNLWFINGLPKLANQLNADVVHLSFPFPFLKNRFKARRRNYSSRPLSLRMSRKLWLSQSFIQSAIS